MNHYAYRIVNVFAEAPLEGNPLCVFEDGRGLDDATMQALALQFNLSETTFLLPSERATAVPSRTRRSITSRTRCTSGEAGENLGERLLRKNPEYKQLVKEEYG